VADTATALVVRPATPADAAAVGELLAASYGALLAPAYPPDVLAAALPAMTRANPGLLACGTWYLAEAGGALAGCGGWTFEPPGRRRAWRLNEAHARHFATHPRWTRRGVGSALLRRSLAVARACGARRMWADASLAAVEFYAAHGFDRLRRVVLTMGGGVPFDAVRMVRAL
jgi:GNAT superfamily N-acetyltransferase